MEEALVPPIYDRFGEKLSFAFASIASAAGVPNKIFVSISIIKASWRKGLDARLIRTGFFDEPAQRRFFFLSRAIGFFRVLWDNPFMDNKAVFNATICLIGMLILLVHITNILMKKGRRKDENALLAFLIFTAIHFMAYFAFVFIKMYFPSDALIMGFYTGFYIANNVQVFLLVLYMLRYVEVSSRIEKGIRIGNIALFSVFVVLDIVNLFVPMFFRAEGGNYVRTNTMFLSQGYQFVFFVVVFLVAITNKKLNLREKIAFSVYCFLPLLAIVFQNLFPGYAIAYLSIIVAIEVLFFFLNVERNLALAREEEKAKDAQIRMMLSQIQPHFIYNSLSSISTLIPIDPEKAQKALDDFTEYLRANLSSLTETKMISFEDELRHIETFLSLEKVRFGERVNVVYDIQVSDFYVPPLTVQPLVENAVRHGILQKVEGGTVRLSAYETESHYVVEVLDDGVGFDQNEVDFSSNTHIGINNISYRLAKMGKGELKMKSKPGEGAKVTVYFQK